MMNKAIFLDRDGVLNVERGYTHRLEDFVILPGVIETLQLFQQKGYLLIIVSNQGGVQKGLYNQEDVEILHNYLLNEFSKNNITITEVYYCIHYPTVSNCICRKPDSLFVEKALARFNIDATKSYFIGDKERDTAAAAKAGITGILIEANTPLKNIFHHIDLS